MCFDSPGEQGSETEQISLSRPASAERTSASEDNESVASHVIRTGSVMSGSIMSGKELFAIFVLFFILTISQRKKQRTN